MLKKAGCYRIDFGFESADPNVLRDMAKTTPEIIRECLDNANKVSFDEINLYHIIGFPTETIDSVKKTIAFIKEYEAKIPILGIYSGIYRPGLTQKLRIGLYTKYGIQIDKITPESLENFSQIYTDVELFFGATFTKGMTRKQINDSILQYKQLSSIKDLPLPIY